MMLGSVTNLEARMELILYPPGQPDRLVEFVVDTGFEGELALPLCKKPVSYRPALH